MISSSDSNGKIPIAVQLFSVRHACKENFAGTLAAVAKMGYDGVEFAGYYDTPAGELRKMLDDLGLRAAGTHIQLATMEGDELARTERLGDIVVSTQLQAVHDVILFITHSEQDDGRAGLPCASFFRPDPLAHSKAIELWHVDVQHDQVGLLLGPALQSSLTIVGLRHLKPFASKGKGQHIG